MSVSALTHRRYARLFATAALAGTVLAAPAPASALRPPPPECESVIHCPPPPCRPVICPRPPVYQTQEKVASTSARFDNGGDHQWVTATLYRVVEVRRSTGERRRLYAYIYVDQSVREDTWLVSWTGHAQVVLPAGVGEVRTPPYSLTADTLPWTDTLATENNHHTYRNDGVLTPDLETAIAANGSAWRIDLW